MANALQRLNENEDSTQRPEEGVSTSALVASIPDERDVAERAPEADTSGKRVRGIPTHGGSTILVSKEDFEFMGVKDQGKVVWDFRKDNFTVKVGGGENEISEDAAKALTEHEPLRFEYINE